MMQSFIVLQPLDRVDHYDLTFEGNGKSLSLSLSLQPLKWGPTQDAREIRWFRKIPFSVSLCNYEKKIRP